MIQRPEIKKGEVLVTPISDGTPFSFLLDTLDYSIIADEPTNFGGSNRGISPFDLLIASLAICTAMTL